MASKMTFICQGERDRGDGTMVKYELWLRNHSPMVRIATVYGTVYGTVTSIEWLGAETQYGQDGYEYMRRTELEADDSK